MIDWTNAYQSQWKSDLETRWYAYRPSHNAYVTQLSALFVLLQQTLFNCLSSFYARKASLVKMKTISSINCFFSTDLRTAFDLLDRDQDGMVTPTELQFMLRNLGIEMSDELIDSLMKEASKTGKLQSISLPTDKLSNDIAQLTLRVILSRSNCTLRDFFIQLLIFHNNVPFCWIRPESVFKVWSCVGGR